MEYDSRLMTLPYQQEDIARNLEPRFVRRGYDYFSQGKVLRVLHPEPHRLKGWVEGSGRQRYEVDVHFMPGRQHVIISGECTCPVGYDCKHVAAVLFAALADQPEQKAPRTASDPLTEWLTEVERALHGGTERKKPRHDYPAAERKRILYLIDVRRFGNRDLVTVDPVTAYEKKDGSFSRVTPYAPQNALSYQASHVLDSDLRILRWLYVNGGPVMEHWKRLETDDAVDLFRAILETGRARWRDANGPTLRPGDERRASPGWSEPDDAGRVRPQVVVEPGPAELLPFPGHPWYLDPASGECGPLRAEAPAAVLAAWQQGPALEATRAEKALKRLDGLSVPPPPRLETVELAPEPPVPVARLQTIRLTRPGLHTWQDTAIELPILVLAFDYAGQRISPGTPGDILSRRCGDRLERRPRVPEAETEALAELERCGFVPLDEIAPSGTDAPAEAFFIDSESDVDDWMDFLLFEVPRLEAAGWRFETDEDFPLRIARPGEWDVEIEPQGNDWFDLELGIEIDGERVPLLPILSQILEQGGDILRHWRDLPEGHVLLATLEDGRILPLPTARLGPLYETLIELFDRERPVGETRLRLPAPQAPEIARLEKALPDAAWQGQETLRGITERLRRLERLRPLPAPRGFKAKLRDYQKAGLGWLQALHGAGLNGVLADDMGLGKTVQTLAHILHEKREGRLDRPALVVAPTSLLFNWRREAEQFAPALSVLTLHGPERKHRFNRIPEHDLVLTTYALLPRDEDELLAHAWHLVVLDEAQHIKNPKAKAGQVARRLDARHRLCLTGTPLENHLGELWSLFDFLMPGLLGDERRFRRLFRTPIEKEGDEARREALSRRIAPFLLRRTKEQVAAELPPKTEIVRSVELSGPQRDLYESIRLAMHEKVRRAIEKKGVKRAHIEILDALLKLRQVCCDPRLLKLEAARKVKRSAKLELLAELLPELVEEGRRILLFSQFTTMLGLIEDEAKRLKLDYVKLTGRTRDRQTPVDRFQAGEVPLFLISLKAGGTGLNLTAADTVIHYDPWWNPAVERQATDRAHRIGQDKPVFVYKLIAAGTVEERIQRMQAEKQALADGLLGGAAKAKLPSPEEIAELFAPLA